MNSFFRHKRTWGAIVALLIISISCTKVDNQLGEDLIPDDQKMKIFVDTLYGIDT